MKPTDTTHTALLDSRQALSFYLETLFDDTDTVEQEAAKCEDTLCDREQIEIMKITLGKHKLALTVEDLVSVIELDQQMLVRLPEQKPYTLGMIRHHGKNLAVYDLNWVFNSSGRLQPPAESESYIPSHAVILQGERMALACTGVNDIITVNNEQVNWSKLKANQRWLTGIIIDDMSVLLEVKQVKCLFNKGYSEKP